MGHQYGDFDCIAAGFAISSLARSYGKTTKNIINIQNLDVKAKRHLEPFMGADYIAKHVVDPKRADRIETENTLLIIVDTSVPSRVEAPDLLEKGMQTIVLDHHRRGQDYIQDTLVQYVEPGASSTSEIVTEIIEFNNAEQPLNDAEINLLFTGIVVDTNNFKSTRVGPRTFVASGILKK
jgi:c-di-AMP phosphodiesterase-like protein